MQAHVTVISLGGSIIAPSAPRYPADLSADSAPRGVDTAFLKGFAAMVDDLLERDPERKLIIVCGGGILARDYQAALREVSADARAEDLDWVGIAATRVNGELLLRIFHRWCREALVTDPTAPLAFDGRIMIAAGWKPGFSTDNDAVVLAQRFSADTVINLSNIAHVYSDDPKVNPAARPLEKMSWKDMLAIVGGEWTPGKNTPFDPTAARAAAASHIRVIFAEGRDLSNLSRILVGASFTGTTIGPQ